MSKILFCLGIGSIVLGAFALHVGAGLIVAGFFLCLLVAIGELEG